MSRRPAPCRWLLPLLFVLLTACSDLLPTGTDTADQGAAAGLFLPAPTGYVRSDAASISDALATLGGGASLLGGNPALAVAISSLEGMIQCYQDVGAVAAGIYTPESLGNLLQGQAFSLGAVAVINQDRLSRNFLNCALGDLGFSAQADALQICSGSGSLLVASETIHYLYAATDSLLCQTFQTHFDAL